MRKCKLGSLPSKSQRLPGGGRKPHVEDMEEVLTAWIEQQRGRHLRVTRTAIQRKAVELYDGDGEFTASRGLVREVP